MKAETRPGAPAVDGVKDAQKHVARWMRPQRRAIDRMPAYFPPEKLQFFDETGGVGIEFSKLPFDRMISLLIR